MELLAVVLGTLADPDVVEPLIGWVIGETEREREAPPRSRMYWTS